TLVDGGERRAGLTGALAKLDGAAAAERGRRADVLLDVRTAYYRALAAGREGEVRRDAASALADFVTRLEAQAKLGIASTNDVLRARLAVAAAEASERAAAGELAEARRELASLAGVGESEALEEPAEPVLRELSAETLDAAPALAE